MDENAYIEFENQLRNALSEGDEAGSKEICRKIEKSVRESAEEFPLQRARSILNLVRRKRRFDLVSVLAEAIIASGQTHVQVRLQYVQALIGMGLLAASLLVVDDVLAETDLSKAERLEAIGLKGRIHKQHFVDYQAAAGATGIRNFEMALEQYLCGYRLDDSSYWHIINAVALIHRGKRDGLLLDGAPDPEVLAGEVCALLRGVEESMDPPRPWELATLLEAHISLGDYEMAATAAMEYSSLSEADAFEIGSTIRQLIEIWQLADDTPPGDKILPVLRSALLDREGGAVRLTPENVIAEKLNLESSFGDSAPKTIKWYRLGLERTASIVRIELPDGRGIGTAALVDGKEFFPDFEGLLLLTNAHVVSENPADSGLRPDQVKANFQGLGEVFEIESVVWSSPQTELDSSFLTIKGSPGAAPLPISGSQVQITNPAPRVYVIGHPSGRDLEISLNDNRLVGTNETFLHYRTPTEPGSSGSPVFEQFGWEMIALHHGGSDSVPRLDNEPGTYQANEGISINAIKNAIEQASSQTA